MTALYTLFSGVFLTLALLSTPVHASDDFLNIDLNSNTSGRDSLLPPGIEKTVENARTSDQRLQDEVETLSAWVIHSANARDLDGLWDRYTELKKRVSPDSDDIILARRQGAAIIAAMRVLSCENDPLYKETWNEALYRDSRALAGRYPKNAELVHRQAEAAALLSSVYRESRKADKIPLLYEETRPLAILHATDEQIMAHTAEIIEDAVIAYRNVGDFAKADSWYATLETRVGENPQQKEAAIVLARTTRALATGYSATGDTDKALPLYESLRAQVRSFPLVPPALLHDTSLEAQQAMTLPPLIAALLRSEQKTKAEELFENLSMLDSDDSDIARAQAEATGLLLNVYTLPDDREKIEALRKRIRQLAMRHPFEANALAHLATMNELRSAPLPFPDLYPIEQPATLHDTNGVPFYEFRYVEAEEKLAATPTDATAILFMAETMSQLSRVYLQHDDPTRARSMYARLVLFVRAHPNNMALARQQMAAAVNLINASDFPESETLYNDARSLAEQYPHDLLLARWRGWAGLNLAVAYMKAGRLDEIRAVRDDVKRGLREHPADTEIIRTLGDMTRRLLIGTGEQLSDPQAVRGFYTDIMELTAPYTSDDGIVLLRVTTLRNITELYIRLGLWQDGRKEFYPELKKSVDAYKGSPLTGYDLAVQQAVTASGLLSSALEADQPLEAHTLYKDLVTLNITYPNKMTRFHDATRHASPIAEITTAQMQGAEKLATLYGQQNKLSALFLLYGDVKRITLNFAQNDQFQPSHIPLADETRHTIAGQQARIGALLIAAHRKARQGSKASAVMKDLEALTRQWPEDENIRQIWQSVQTP